MFCCSFILSLILPIAQFGIHQGSSSPSVNTRDTRSGVQCTEKLKEWKTMFPEEEQNCTQNLKNADFVSDVYNGHVVRNFVLQYVFFFKSPFNIVSKVALAISKSKEIL